MCHLPCANQHMGRNGEEVQRKGPSSCLDSIPMVGEHSTCLLARVLATRERRVAVSIPEPGRRGRATFCAFMLGATRTAAPSSAPRIDP